MASPQYNQAPDRLIVPADKFVAITTATTTLVADPSRGLYIGGSTGTIGFTDRNGTSTYTVSVTPYSVLPFQITQLSSVSAGVTVYALR